MRILIIVVFVAIPCVFGMVQCSYLGDRIGCHSRWVDSGYESRFGIMSGCMVQVKGRWMPEKSVRDVQ